METTRPYKDLTEQELLEKATEWHDGLRKLQTSDAFETTEEYKHAADEFNSKYDGYFEEIKLRRKELCHECTNS